MRKRMPLYTSFGICEPHDFIFLRQGQQVKREPSAGLHTQKVLTIPMLSHVVEMQPCGFAPCATQLQLPCQSAAWPVKLMSTVVAIRCSLPMLLAFDEGPVCTCNHSNRHGQGFQGASCIAIKQCRMAFAVVALAAGTSDNSYTGTPRSHASSIVWGAFSKNLLRHLGAMMQPDNAQLERSVGSRPAHPALARHGTRDGKRSRRQKLHQGGQSFSSQDSQAQ